MIVIDTFLEWTVILAGILMALAILFPNRAAKVGDIIKAAIPHPSTVNEWLKKIGL
jgi:hypothetical protein